MHILAELIEVPVAHLVDRERWTSAVEEACAAAGLNILGEVVLHSFPGGGLTGVAVLSESHLAFHTYPELGYAAVDVFTCSGRDPAVALEVLREWLRPGRVTSVVVQRGPDGRA